MGQAAFERYVAPARSYGQLWRTLAGLALILAGWVIWTALVLIAWTLPDIVSGMAVTEALRGLESDFLSGRPHAIAMTLLTFAGIWPSVWLAVRLLHRRRLRTVLASRPGDLIFGFGLAALLWIVAMLAALVLVGPPQRSVLGLEVWAFWLMPLAVLVFLQAGGEELIFRGYLLQNLAARTRSPLVWGVLPSLVFAALHYDPGRGPAMNGLYVGTVLMFGLTAAVLVWRTGALWAGIGLHAGNNLGALTLVGVEGLTAGSQLFVHLEAAKTPLLVVDAALMTLVLLWMLSPACPQRLRSGARNGAETTPSRLP